MTATVQKLIESFDKLSSTEKHEAAVEILRRFGSAGDLQASTLVGAADDLFSALDAEEAADASR